MDPEDDTMPPTERPDMDDYENRQDYPDPEGFYFPEEQ